jgi:hypothetical protein
MAGAGLRRIVSLIALRKHDSFRQALEAAVEALAILLEEIGRELVDRDRDDQLGRRLLGGGGRGRGGKDKRGEARAAGDLHGLPPTGLGFCIYSVARPGQGR